MSTISPTTRASARRLRNALGSLTAGAAVLVAALALAPGSAGAAPFVYVTNDNAPPGSGRGGEVLQFDAAPGLLAHLSFPGPATRAADGAVAVTPDGTSVYVANPTANSVSQYDVAADGTLTAKTPATVNTGVRPSAIAVTSDGKAVYVANAFDNTVSQYDIGPGGRITPTLPATVATGRIPVGVAVSPDGKSVYVVDLGENAVRQYSVGVAEALTPKTPATVAAGSHPGAIAVSPNGSSAYVANNDGTMSQYDIGAGGALTPKTPATVPVGDFPIAIAVSPDSHKVYVPRSDGLVVQYDASGGGLTLKTPATVAAGNAPSAIAVSPAGDVYVTNAIDGTVSQYAGGLGFPTLTPLTLASVLAGTDPNGIAVGPTRLVFRCTNVFSPCATHIQPVNGSVGILATLVRAAPVGILVQRIVGKRRVLVGLVPFGSHRTGRLRIRWNLRVRGHRLHPGRYLITLRGFDAHQHLIAHARPVPITVK